jgi:hypothetical protein
VLAAPPAPAKRGPGPRTTDPSAHLIDAWLRRQPTRKASVTSERLACAYGFTGHNQRGKLDVGEHRARLTATEPEPVGSTSGSRSSPGAQAQVEGGDEGDIQTQAGRCGCRAST